MDVVTASIDTKHSVDVPSLEDSASHGYSQCVRTGRLVFIAGQCGRGTGPGVVSTEFEPQARAAIERVRAAVEAAGGTLADITAVTVFLTDIRLGPEFNRIRRDYFTQPYPTSALIGVSALMPPGGLIEIQAIAVVPADTDRPPDG